MAFCFNHAIQCCFSSGHDLVGVMSSPSAAFCFQAANGWLSSVDVDEDDAIRRSQLPRESCNCYYEPKRCNK